MISASLIHKLENAGLDIDLVEARINAALAEDLHDEDLTSKATIDSSQSSSAKFRSRKHGVVAGLPIAAAVLEIAGITDIRFMKNDGDHVIAGDTLIECNGNTRSILLAERTALNFLSHLSGIATLTNNWVKAISGTKARIRDTRKTTPGLRQLEKYAVRVGGGLNHRMTLADGALIKDNHIAAAGSLTEAINRVRREFPGIEVEVEVDNLEQLREALDTKVDIIMLDNMTVDETKSAVALARDYSTKLESSGGLTLESAAAYAATGVDYLAVGALTHSAPILDIGLDFGTDH